MTKLTKQLPDARVREIYDSIIDTGLFDARSALLSGLQPHLAASLPTQPSPATQVMSDLETLNAIYTPQGDLSPLQIYVDNAAILASELESGAVLTTAAEDIARQLAEAEAGESEPLLAVDAPDPLLSPEFLISATRAASSVALLRRDRMRATGCLIGSRHLVTAAHVLDDRTTGPVADETIHGLSVVFDYDADSLPGVEARVRSCAALDRELDYVVLEMAEDTWRTPLRLVEKPAQGRLSSVGHAAGGPKKLTLLDSLAVKSGERSLRYVSESPLGLGSSGAPVFDAAWGMVAIQQRGRLAVPPIRLRGRDIHRVQEGLRADVLASHLRQESPQVWAALQD